MDTREFKKQGTELVNYVAEYLDNIKDAKVSRPTQRSFLQDQIAASAPSESENWSAIFEDFKKLIVPEVLHCESPRMHAYSPTSTSYPSILSDLLSNIVNSLGLPWIESSVSKELEVVVTNWLGKMIGLPHEFFYINESSPGGGTIETSISEATLLALLAGRTKAIKKYQETYPDLGDVSSKLVAYCSEQAHSVVEKAARTALVKLRKLPTDSELRLRGDALQEAIRKDKEEGQIPFWVCVTLGTAATCAFDNLEEISTVAVEENLWVHVDAGYAGGAFICPEFKIWLKGIDKVDSIALDPSKWLKINYDCATFWVKDRDTLQQTFGSPSSSPVEEKGATCTVDFERMQIPRSRSSIALKLWFVLRNYGIVGLQKHIRKQVRFAEKFESLVRADYRFEIMAQRNLNVVLFRLRGGNDVTKDVLKEINARGNIYCVAIDVNGKYTIRFPVTSPYTTEEDIRSDWKEFPRVVDELFTYRQEQVKEKSCWGTT